MTRVLLVGGLNLGQTLRSTARGFQRLGCEIQHVPTYIYGPKGKTAGNIVAIGEAVSAFRPDILFWWCCKGDCPAGIVHYVKAMKRDVITVAHSFDDPFEMDVAGAPWAGQFDAVVTCCEGTVQDYLARGVKRVACLYPPCDLDLHTKAIVKPEYACDFSFAGTNIYPHEKYPYVTVERRAVIRAAAKLGSLQLWGHWDKSCNGWGHETWGAPELAESYKGWADYDMLPDIYASAKITLCTHVRPDGYRYLNERVTAAMGSGGFILTDRVNGINELFRLGYEMDAFASLDEFEEKARYWLTHDAEREAAAEAGRKVALERYNNQVYAEAILNLCRSV